MARWRIMSPAVQSDRKQMLMNWPERVWIYSPVRTFFLRLHAKKWLKLVGRQEVQAALEIGCGLGRGARVLVDKMGFESVSALDLETALVMRAHRRLPGRLRTKISFFAADAQDLPFGDSIFDAVVNYGIIHHVVDWRRCIREVARVLKPGGIFYFEEIYPPLYANVIFKHVIRHPTENRFDGSQFLQALAESGLELVQGVSTHSRFAIVGAARKAKTHGNCRMACCLNPAN